MQLIAMGYRDQGDSDLLRRDPVLRLAVSDAADLSPLSETSLPSLGRCSLHESPHADPPCRIALPPPHLFPNNCANLIEPQRVNRCN